MAGMMCQPDTRGMWCGVAGRLWWGLHTPARGASGTCARREWDMVRDVAQDVARELARAVARAVARDVAREVARRAASLLDREEGERQGAAVGPSVGAVERLLAEHLARVQGSGLRVQGSEFRVQGSRFRVQGSGFRVHRQGSSRLPRAVQGLRVMNGFSV